MRSMIKKIINYSCLYKSAYTLRIKKLCEKSFVISLDSGSERVDDPAVEDCGIACVLHGN